MAIIRTQKNTNYTVMSNRHLRDQNLSLKAKGLLSMVLSLPENWDYSIAGLVAICKENETAVNSCIKELKTYGYLKVTKERNEKGQFEYVYTFLEIPDIEKPGVENPWVGFPGVDVPAVENQGQLNKDRVNTDNKGIYKGISRFEDFWNAYPKQIHRTLAEQAYIKSLMGGSTEDWLVDAAKEYKLCMQGTESRFVKNPENWLADNCYLDYPPGTYAKRCEEQKKAAQAPPKAAKPTGTKFSNFEQRPYDFDDLESKLLQGF